MARATKSKSVPAARLDSYERLSALTDDFCKTHLNDGYRDLARYAIAALCRKRPNPLLSGKATTWACGVLYAIGQVNFLFDKGSALFMRSAELCAHFNVATSTGGNKAKQVMKALGIERYGFQWAMPETIELGGSLYWMIEFNGMIVDARELPRVVQEAAFEKGMIPYVHADNGKSAAQIFEAREVLERYDRYRSISVEHQLRLGDEVYGRMLPAMAQRLGLIAAPSDFNRAKEEIDLVPAMDFTLYSIDDDGVSVMARDLETWPGPLNDDKRRMFSAMSQSVFSIYEVVEKHELSGLVLRDLFAGEKYWLIDRGLEASTAAGMRIALRLIHADDFWIATGMLAIVDDDTWKQVAQHFTGDNRRSPHPDKLAEFLFRILSAKYGALSAAA